MIETSLAQPHRSGRLRPAATALATILVALAAAAGVTFVSSDSIVTRGFEVALDGQQKSVVKTATAERNATSPVAGTEDYWLSRGKSGAAPMQVEPAAWSTAAGSLSLTVGDRITIKSQGAERVLEIIDIADVSPGTTRIDAGRADHRDVLVTCRDTSAGGETVRFMTSRLAVPGEAKPIHAL